MTIKMIDISDKEATHRTASACVRVVASKSLINKIKSKKLPKGDCLVAAKVAAILAAKNVAAIIPLCHQIHLAHVDMDFKFGTQSIEIFSCVKAHYATGVEMEALLACAVAALTIYDMAKLEEKGMVISDLRLLKKSGGKSGEYIARRS